jgi:phage FluMu protein Com
MPIRFRCRYCNQLMGIARRKAGTMVSCPTCHAQVEVPQPDDENQAPPAPGTDAVAPLFERSDFEAFLDNPVAEPAPPAPFPSFPPPTSPHSPLAPSSPSIPSPSVSARGSAMPGLLLSPTQATWLTVVVILLLGLAFGAGLLVGYYWMR